MQLQKFNFESNEIGAILKNDEPWFVARDVCLALGLANPSQAMTTHVDPDDKAIHPVDTLGGQQVVSIVNESGMYALIFGSRKPEAKRFKKWVTSEVLPSIRKTGGYSMTDFKVPTTLSGALRLAAEQAEQIEAQAILIEQQRPAVEFVERYVEAKSSKAISDVAKILGVKPQAFFTWLHDCGIIFKRGGSWVPYSGVEHNFEVKTGEANGHAFTQAKFTPEGIAWISAKWNRHQK